jgi:hypothetical protein
MVHADGLKSTLISTIPTRQRTVSSYCPQTSLSRKYSLFQKCISEAYVEYCAVNPSPQNKRPRSFIVCAHRFFSGWPFIDG